MARLRIETGKGQGKSVDLERQGIVGRGETAQLQIHDLKASREHCKVFEQAGVWNVADLNSRNGIKVNGILTTRKTLSHGDRIEIGETVIVFELPGATETADTPLKTDQAPAAAPVRPAAPVKGGAAEKKAAAMADARAAAAKGAPASARPAAATKARAGGAAATGKGLEVSDRVLQFHKVDPRKATVLDVDLAQSAAGQKTLIVLGCIAFLGGLIWYFGWVAGAW